MPNYRNPYYRNKPRPRGSQYHDDHYAVRGEERVYCRILCCCVTWKRRPYRPPPPEVIAARKSNFRHSDEPKRDRSSKKKQGSRVAPVVYLDDIPAHPRQQKTQKGPAAAGDAYARARRLACYSDFVNGVNGAGDRDNGTAALFAAAHVGDVELMEALIHEGFFLNARGDRNETALIVASRAGHFDAVEFLFDSGADMAAKDVAGRNASDHARFAGHHDLADVLHQYGCPNIEVID